MRDYFTTHTEDKQNEDNPPEHHEDPVLLVRKTADEAFTLKDKICKQEVNYTSNRKNISRNVHQCRDGKV